tara:strand:+ start:137 stop:925 length:789 start_codon:yes stop_codon:yes gene_type:complete
MIEMISIRLNKTQKAEILEGYKAGYSTNTLAEKYCCTTNTINRTVKNLLSDIEYQSLKGKRSKIRIKEKQTIDNLNIKARKEKLEQENSLISFKEEDNKLDIGILPEVELDDTFNQGLSSGDLNNQNIDFDKSNYNNDNNFHLIEPLVSDFDFDKDKKKSDFKIFHYENLPEIVYMIVDKKVELEFQLISDLPEWSFLPEKELKRNVILLFANQRSAKRNCSKNQRVIKIPNTSIFKLSKTYLISKGITRLILEDSMFSLDN